VCLGEGASRGAVRRQSIDISDGLAERSIGATGVERRSHNACVVQLSWRGNGITALDRVRPFSEQITPA
jgi:hypothetical protein